ncbi:hypothetical protein Pelo_5883 [Pelomyxa schiedti]|nr:hypothetical protein Pelo_5883 [Pelomyxa schiedti]
MQQQGGGILSFSLAAREYESYVGSRECVGEVLGPPGHRLVEAVSAGGPLLTRSQQADLIKATAPCVEEVARINELVFVIGGLDAKSRGLLSQLLSLLWRALHRVDNFSQTNLQSFTHKPKPNKNDTALFRRLREIECAFAPALFSSAPVHSAEHAIGVLIENYDLLPMEDHSQSPYVLHPSFALGGEEASVYLDDAWSDLDVQVDQQEKALKHANTLLVKNKSARHNSDLHEIHTALAFASTKLSDVRVTWNALRDHMLKTSNDYRKIVIKSQKDIGNFLQNYTRQVEQQQHVFQAQIEAHLNHERELRLALENATSQQLSPPVSTCQNEHTPSSSPTESIRRVASLEKDAKFMKASLQHHKTKLEQTKKINTDLKITLAKQHKIIRKLQSQSGVPKDGGHGNRTTSEIGESTTGNQQSGAPDIQNTKGDHADSYGNALAHQLAQSEQEKSTMSKQLSEVTCSLSTVLSQLNAAKDAMNEKEQVILNSIKDKDALLTKLSHMQKENNKLSKLLEERTEINTSATTLNNKLQNEITSLQRALRDAKAEVVEATSERQSNLQQFSKLESYAHKLESQIEQADAETKHYQTVQQQQLSRIHQLETALSTSQAEKSDLTESLQQQQSSAQTLQDHLVIAEQALSEKVSTLQNTSAELESVKAELQQTQDELARVKEKHRAAIEYGKQMRMMLQEQTNYFPRANSGDGQGMPSGYQEPPLAKSTPLADRFHQCNKDYQETEQQIATLKETIKQLQEEKNDLTAQAQEQQQLNTTATAETEKLSLHHKQSKEKWQQSQQELQARFEEQQISHMAQLQTLQAELDNSKSKLTECTTKIRNYEEQLAKLQEEMSSFQISRKNEYSSQQQTITQLQTQLRDLKQQFSATVTPLQEELQEYQSAYQHEHTRSLCLDAAVAQLQTELTLVRQKLTQSELNLTDTLRTKEEETRNLRSESQQKYNALKLQFQSVHTRMDRTVKQEMAQREKAVASLASLHGIVEQYEGRLKVLQSQLEQLHLQLSLLSGGVLKLGPPSCTQSTTTANSAPSGNSPNPTAPSPTIKIPCDPPQQPITQSPDVVLVPEPIITQTPVKTAALPASTDQTQLYSLHTQINQTLHDVTDTSSTLQAIKDQLHTALLSSDTNQSDDELV